MTKEGRALSCENRATPGKERGQLNKMMNKLRSDRGASITFGLLIFLVCAVICSVIIASASAASGRMANMAEVDQRYYCVTSACGLLKDVIDGKMVTIVETDDATYVVPDKTADDVIQHLDDFTPVGDSYSADSFASYAAYQYHESGAQDGNFEISSSGLTDSGDPAAAKVEEKIKSNGDMVLTVENKGGNEHYKMEMTFGADVTEDNYSKATDTAGGDATVDTIKATTMEWTFIKARTVSSPGD